MVVWYATADCCLRPWPSGKQCSSKLSWPGMIRTRLCSQLHSVPAHHGHRATSFILWHYL
eukprot:2940612-Amphidinium_carterae.1